MLIIVTIAALICWVLGSGFFNTVLSMEDRWFPILESQFSEEALLYKFWGAANPFVRPPREILDKVDMLESIFLHILPYLVPFWVGFMVPYLLASVIVRWKQKRKGILVAAFVFFLNAIMVAMNIYGGGGFSEYFPVAVMPFLTIWWLLFTGELVPAKLPPLSPGKEAAREAARRTSRAHTKAVVVLPENQKKKSPYLETLPAVLILFLGGIGYSQGLFLLAVLSIIVLITYGWKKVKNARPEDFVQIQLPPYWPEDCIYGYYDQGLSEKPKVTPPGPCQRSKRIEELKTLVASMEYYGLHGREKRARILSDLATEAGRKAAELKSLARSAPRNFMQQEVNSGVAGGIANGLAGFGAGLYAAADAERRNAEARAYNRNIAPAVVGVMGALGDGARRYEHIEQRYREQVSQARAAQILEEDPVKAFQLLQIGSFWTSVSNTGAVTVCANFSMKPQFYYSGAVIDGTVAARLYRNGNLEASAYFVLPLEGISTTQKYLEAISTKPIQPGAVYTVKFEPVDLWVMDSM